MSRLSIEISPQQHQHIKAMAAMQGQSIKEFVMGKLFPTDQNEEEALHELKAFLLDRIEQAQTGRLSSKTLQDISNDVLARRRKG